MTRWIFLWLPLHLWRKGIRFVFPLHKRTLLSLVLIGTVRLHKASHGGALEGSCRSPLIPSRTQSQVKYEELPPALHSFCQHILIEYLLCIKYLTGAGNPVVYKTDTVPACCLRGYKLVIIKEFSQAGVVQGLSVNP